MNKQEATELRETILRELPEGFTCTEIIDSSKYNRDTQEVEPIFWFSLRAETFQYPSEVMPIHTHDHWKLLKRFSHAYVGEFDPDIVLDRV